MQNPVQASLPLQLESPGRNLTDGAVAVWSGRLGQEKNVESFQAAGALTALGG